MRHETVIAAVVLVLAACSGSPTGKDDANGSSNNGSSNNGSSTNGMSGGSSTSGSSNNGSSTNGSSNNVSTTGSTNSTNAGTNVRMRCDGELACRDDQECRAGFCDDHTTCALATYTESDAGCQASWDDCQQGGDHQFTCVVEGEEWECICRDATQDVTMVTFVDNPCAQRGVHLAANAACGWLVPAVPVE